MAFLQVIRGSTNPPARSNTSSETVMGFGGSPGVVSLHES